MVEDYSKVEFNSNVAVLIRVNKIIDAIIDSRIRTTVIDSYGNPMSEAEEYLSHIIALYMEISVELTETEDEVWQKLIKLRDKLRVRPPKPRLETMAYWRRTISDLDDLQREIRLLAKKHGFLSSNKKNIKKSVLRT